MSVVLRILEVLATLGGVVYLLARVIVRVRAWRMGRIVGPFVLVLLTCGPAVAANSQWAQTHPTEVVCDEPLQGTSYATVNGYDFNPNDTSALQCTKATPSVPGSVLEDGGGFRYVIETSGEMFNALPPGATAHHLLRTKHAGEGNIAGGGQFAGHDFSNTPGKSHVRREFQGFKYWSTNADVIEDGGPDDGNHCVNTGKILQMGKDSILSAILTTGPSMYGWIGWNFGTLSCCVTGPGFDTSPMTYNNAAMQGKWFRWSLVATNTATTGGTTVFKIYARNITDDTPEVKIIDSSIAHTVDQPGAPINERWTAAIASTVKPSANDWDQFYFDLFRRDVCNGFVGLAYLTAAAWDTDAGQRIGRIVEMEGPSDASPSGTLALFLRGLALAHLGGTGAFLWQRRAEMLNLYAASKEIVWMWRWKRAVKRWQRAAPAMIAASPTTIDVPVSQYRVQGEAR